MFQAIIMVLITRYYFLTQSFDNSRGLLSFDSSPLQIHTSQFHILALTG